MLMQAIKQRVKSMLSKAVEPQMVELKAKLERIERIVSTPPAPGGASTTIGAIWRGGIGGLAIDAAGRECPAMTIKYRDELAFWHHAIKNDPIGAFHGPYEDIYGGWQRGRLEELREFLGLASWADLEAWAAARSAIEIGPGPYPSISLLQWKRGIAVDPLVDAYVAEDLLPKRGHCDKLVLLASAAERIPLPGNSFDIMVAENCLDHVDDPGAVVAEVKRVLAPGGLFWLLVDLMEYRDHMHPNPFSEQSLVALLKQHGFEIVRHRVNGHKSHPNAYGEFRGLLRKA
ncbi:MAG: class I SAM-dependent methyltransferase [Phycisphaerae bacterium]|nr:class I SAM-dependent methyltransferase [Phycisphaerae bacterium]